VFFIVFPAPGPSVGTQHQSRETCSPRGEPASLQQPHQKTKVFFVYLSPLSANFSHACVICRRPWPENTAGLDSPVSSKDEFWAAIQRDYNYLMGRQLIDSCCQVLQKDNNYEREIGKNSAKKLCYKWFCTYQSTEKSRNYLIFISQYLLDTFY
jgi:hypothetical protein